MRYRIAMAASSFFMLMSVALAISVNNHPTPVVDAARSTLTPRPTWAPYPTQTPGVPTPWPTWNPYPAPLPQQAVQVENTIWVGWIGHNIIAINWESPNPYANVYRIRGGVKCFLALGGSGSMMLPASGSHDQCYYPQNGDVYTLEYNGAVLSQVTLGEQPFWFDTFMPQVAN